MTVEGASDIPDTGAVNLRLWVVSHEIIRNPRRALIELPDHTGCSDIRLGHQRSRLGEASVTQD